MVFACSSWSTLTPKAGDPQLLVGTVEGVNGKFGKGAVDSKPGRSRSTSIRFGRSRSMSMRFDVIVASVSKSQ